jgi:hypothetical protein
MAIFYSPQNEIRDLTGVSPFPAAFRVRKIRSRRLRTLARRALRRTRLALATLHQAIVTARTRRLRREMMLYAGTRDELISPLDTQSHSPELDLLKFPQRPLILGEKWDY